MAWLGLDILRTLLAKLRSASQTDERNDNWVYQCIDFDEVDQADLDQTDRVEQTAEYLKDGWKFVADVVETRNGAIAKRYGILKRPLH